MTTWSACLYRLLAVFVVVAIGLPSGAESSCLPIDTVHVAGASVLQQEEVAEIVGPFEQQCLGLAAFDQILEALSLAYVDKGYVLSRAYLPEQDLTTRLLRVEIVEGTLTGIHLNGQPELQWMGKVFPGQLGKPVNIRDVEQGLDLIQAMPRWTAKMEFDPGLHPGETVLEVTADTPRRYGFAFSTNNQGNEQSGVWKSEISGDFTNLLGLSDTLTWQLGKTLNSGPLSFRYDGDANRNAGIAYSLAYGRWTFKLDHSWSDYVLTIPGAISPIKTDGWSRTRSLSTKYLLSRGQTTKQFVNVKLTQAVNANYIQDTRIDASSRTLSDVRFGYSISTPLVAGNLNAELYVQRGLDWFGAIKSPDLLEGSPEPQYRLLGYSADYARTLDGQSGRTRWTSTLSGQFSRDRLYGSQGYSIGGVSTVRGSKVALASGNSGALWRNEVAHVIGEPHGLGRASLYGAFDIGHVFEQSSLDIRQAIAKGIAVGLKISGAHLTGDVSYQEIRSVSDRLQQPEGSFLVSLEMRF